MGSTDRSPTLDEKIKALTSTIASITYVSQLKPMAAAHGRLKIHELITGFALEVREELQAKNRELSRKLYIAEKAAEAACMGDL
jgi:hypothetical protein